MTPEREGSDPPEPETDVTGAGRAGAGGGRPDVRPGGKRGATRAGTGEAAAGEAAAGEDDDDELAGVQDGGGDHGRGENGDESPADTTQDQIDLSELESFLAGSDEVKNVAAQRDEYLDSLRRLQADFDNYRKRAIRQQTELVERATEGLLVRLLPVLDALDLAMAHLPSTGEAGTSEAMKSLTQIGTLLRDVLEREGLERIDQVGVPFDPTIHDAVARTGPVDSPDEGAPPGRGDGAAVGEDGAADDEDLDRTAPDEGVGNEAATEDATGGRAGAGTPNDNSVATVMRSGYRMKGRVLRPAMVAVQG